MDSCIYYVIDFFENVTRLVLLLPLNNDQVHFNRAEMIRYILFSSIVHKVISLASSWSAVWLVTAMGDYKVILLKVNEVDSLVIHRYFVHLPLKYLGFVYCLAFTLTTDNLENKSSRRNGAFNSDNISKSF